MKRLLKTLFTYLLLFLFSMLLVYITGVFNTGDFNIQHWVRESRNANTMLVWVIFGVIVFLYKVNKKVEEHERNFY